MGFLFGMMMDIDHFPGSMSFIAGICFVVIFEFCIGYLEYNLELEGSLVYGQMVQKIYKELMLMGVISFTVVMYEASKEHPTHLEHLWVLSIDFGHMLLFFVAIFYVVHAMVLIRVSSVYSKYYRYLFTTSVVALTETIDIITSNTYSLANMLYNFQLVNLSTVKEQAEFKIWQRIFTDTYCLSPDFNVSMYFNGCFDRYMLKAVEGGVLTWSVLIVLSLLNYVRIAFSIGLHCSDVTTNDDHHDDHTDDHSDDHSPTYAPTVHVRYLSATATDDSHELSSCEMNNALKYIFGGCVLLCSFLLALLVIARVYEMRILRTTGIREVRDYKPFLQFTDYHRKKMLRLFHHRGTPIFNTIPRKELRETVQELLDEEEHDEETEIYRVISEKMSALSLAVNSFILESLGKIRLAFSEGTDVASKRMDVFKNKVDTVQEMDSNVHHHSIAHRLSHAQESGSHNNGNEVRASEPVNPTAPKSPKPGGQFIRAASFVAQDAESNEVVPFKPSDMKGVEENSDEESSNSENGEIKESACDTTDISALLKAQWELKKDSSGHMTVDRMAASVVPHTNASVRSKRRSSVSTLAQAHIVHRPTVVPGVEDVEATAAGGPTQEEVAKNSEWSLKDMELVSASEVMTPCERFKLSIALKYPEDHKDSKIGVEPSEDQDPTVALEAVFLFGKPEWFFRCVYIGIMLNSFYMAIWATNLVTLVWKYTERNSILWQLLMCLPIVFNIPCLANTVQICSKLNALVNLDINVVSNVLEEMDDMDFLKAQLRERILEQISDIEGFSESDILNMLFSEIDVDKSGFIEPSEFRELLAKLNLKYSDRRFRRLFAAVDLTSDGCIQHDEIDYLVFPDKYTITDDNVLVRV